MTRKELNEIIDNIPASITYDHGYDMRLAITGSFLLYLHGLVDRYDDVEILVVDAPKSFWSELFSNDYKWDIRDYGDYKSVKVVFSDVTYNFIADDYYRETTNSFADINGDYQFDTLPNALKAKARLNRGKDVNSLKSMIKRFESYATFNQPNQ